MTIFNPSGIISLHNEKRLNMKKQYYKIRPTKKDYFNTTWEAEANVDNGGFETTRNTHKVLREEVIDGKTYKVLSI